MRCISLLMKIKRRTKEIVRRCVLCFMIGFTSLPIISMAEDASFANATLLAEMNMEAGSIDPAALQQSSMQQIEQLGHLNAEDIQAEIQVPTQIDVSIYPIQSKNLTPGIISARVMNLTLQNPIFIVGDDQQSKQWLQSYATRLIKLNAQGFVVNVSNAESMESLKQLAPNLSLYPMPGDAIAQWINLQHYPVLISSHLLEQ